MKLDVLETQKTPWYAEGLNFTCTQCGNCCTGGPGYVWISAEEIGRLAAFLKLTPQQVRRRYCRRVGSRWSLEENRNAQGNYDCVFLEERKVKDPASGVVRTQRVCTIYPVRPLQCRTWPFWEGNLASRSRWEHAAQRCPGMNSGRHYTREQIEALRDASDWPDSPPTSAGAADGTSDDKPSP